MHNSVADLIQSFGYDHGEIVARYGDFFAKSVFHPIFSLNHQRAIGLEALVRIRDDAGQYISPPAFFEKFSSLEQAIFVDRLVRTLHLANFAALDFKGWIFINVNPRVFEKAKEDWTFLERLFAHFRVPISQLVIEVLEGTLDDAAALDSLSKFQSSGCLVAVDDFGAGFSNFDRIWQIRPDIVKLDRKMIVDAVRNITIRRSLPILVSLLHQAGCLVVAEGIEREEEGLIMMDAGVDLGQGFLFTKPFSIMEPNPIDIAAVRQLLITFRKNAVVQEACVKTELMIYEQELRNVAARLLRGEPVQTATASLCNLPRVMRFYLLNADGDQRDHNLDFQQGGSAVDPRFSPLVDAKGACWFHRPYFRNALANPNRIQISRPYFSVSDAHLCITLSLAIELEGRMTVLCLDLNELFESAPCTRIAR